MNRFQRYTDLARARSVMIERVPFRPELSVDGYCQSCGLRAQLTCQNANPATLYTEFELLLLRGGWLIYPVFVCPRCRLVTARQPPTPNRIFN